jgi:uncharacterized membrane protein
MKRPWEVTFLGGLFILVGIAGLSYHLSHGTLDRWMLLIALNEIVAIVCGAFLILGHSWARWALLAWLALHVGISALNSVSDTIAHAVLLAVIAYFLLKSPASRYFVSPAH